MLVPVEAHLWRSRAPSPLIYNTSLFWEQGLNLLSNVVCGFGGKAFQDQLHPAIFFEGFQLTFCSSKAQSFSGGARALDRPFDSCFASRDDVSIPHSGFSGLIDEFERALFVGALEVFTNCIQHLESQQTWVFGTRMDDPVGQRSQRKCSANLILAKIHRFC